ncbi:hypothetical protein B0H66DRAFT_567516 [Apodospora peruviana]|uniref:Ankyrin repeat protein n=1 Tax=Apodospora peruviana TaxID=516989 RepID=A0AAE0HWP8_9PEZI|nr:hypothetical protein B0H66DRAFT_567516 [Apodospora peruviana]
MDSSDHPQQRQSSRLVDQFLRPITSHRPSHMSRMASDHSRVQAEQYTRDANAERMRQLESGTLLHDAVRQSDTAKLRELIAAHDLDLNARDHRGRTALHIAAKFGRVEQLDLLLEQKEINIDATDKEKSTALHLATMYNHRDCIERLLKRGANTELADEKGHLPRYYCSSHHQISLFDNPPKVTRRKGKRSAVPENRTLPEFSLTTMPPAPRGLQQSLSRAFKGSFWEPNSDIKWASPDIWQLIYSDDQPARSQRMVERKWIHLPAVSEAWTKDLVRSICATNMYSRERYREMSEFVSRVFGAVDAEGPERKRHFLRQSSSEKKMESDEMYALVLPVVDVDKRDYVQLARGHRNQVLEGAGNRDVFAGALANVTSDSAARTHLINMLHLCSFLDQPLPRSLDQSYHEHLDTEKVALLDGDQVMIRYIRRLKRKSLDVLKKPAERRVSLPVSSGSSETLPLPRTTTTDITLSGYDLEAAAARPPESEEWASRQSQRDVLEAAGEKDHEDKTEARTRPTVEEGVIATDVEAQKAQNISPKVTHAEHKRFPSTPSPTPSLPEENDLRGHGNTVPEPDDFITVPHFWLFKLDANTIITLYAERLDKSNEARLHDHVLNSISDNQDIQDEEDNIDMNLVAETILRSCMAFEAKAFVQCVNPDAPKDCHDIEVPYTKAYSNSIAELYVQVTERFDSLRKGLGSLSKDPGAFYRDVKEETKILIRVDDNIGEIGMIKRVLLGQAGVFNMFRQAVYGPPGTEPVANSRAEDGSISNSYGNADNNRTGVMPASMETFTQLESEAERVRSMATTLLDLRQREATIEDALSMGEQSTMLFIFTAVTVLFAPLSFVCGLLALSVDGFPEMWLKGPLAEVFGLSTLATIGLCVVMWAVYKVFQMFEVSRRNRERGPPPPPPYPAAISTSPKDGFLVKVRKIPPPRWEAGLGNANKSVLRPPSDGFESMKKDIEAADLNNGNGITRTDGSTVPRWRSAVGRRRGGGQEFG